MLRLLADENFNRDLVRGLLRHRPHLDIVRAQDVELTQAIDLKGKTPAPWQTLLFSERVDARAIRSLAEDTAAESRVRALAYNLLRANNEPILNLANAAVTLYFLSISVLRQNGTLIIIIPPTGRNVHNDSQGMRALRGI